MGRRAFYLFNFLKHLNHPTFLLAMLFFIAVGLTFALSSEAVLARVMLQSSPVSPVEQAPQPPPDPAGPQPAVESEAPTQPAAPLPPPLPEPRQSPREPLLNIDEAPPENQDLILDQAELIDTVVVSTAYVWLCCGIVLILLIPLIFLFLQIRGRSKILKEEQF